MYLILFKADLSDPEILGPVRTWQGEKAMTNIQEMIQANPDIYHNVFSSSSCKGQLYEGRILIKYEKQKAEVIYLEEVYHAIYQKFLAAIDHLEYLPRVSSTTYRET